MSNRTKQAKTASLKQAVAGSKTSPHITKITASSSREAKAKSAKLDGAKVENVVDQTGKTKAQPVANPELNAPEQKSAKKPAKKLTHAEKKALKAKRKANKASTEERPIKSYFVLWRPFVRLGRYLRDSWREIRQVRWPNRKATWKMTLAVLVYVALFMVFLMLIDMLFTFIFDLLFKQ